MTVQQIYTKGELLEPEKLTDVCLLENFCINSNANVTIEDGKDSFIGNPTECALLVAARKAGWDYTKKREETDIAHIFPIFFPEKGYEYDPAYSRRLYALCKGKSGKDHEPVG